METIQKVLSSREFYDHVTIGICQHYIPVRMTKSEQKTSKYHTQMKRIKEEKGIKLNLTKSQYQLIMAHDFSEKQLYEILYGFWLGLDEVVRLYCKKNINWIEMMYMRDLADFYNCSPNEIAGCLTEKGEFSHKLYRKVHLFAYNRFFKNK